MSYEVSVAVQPRRPIAAVAATTTWHRFPGQWRGMLDEVWACLRQAGVKGGCNVSWRARVNREVWLMRRSPRRSYGSDGAP
jgi:hypothetical protein